MVSTLALTAAPLDAAPRPVLAMALVRAFWNELLAPAVAVVDTAGVAAAELVVPVGAVVPAGAVVLVCAAVVVCVVERL